MDAGSMDMHVQLIHGRKDGYDRWIQSLVMDCQRKS